MNRHNIVPFGTTPAGETVHKIHLQNHDYSNLIKESDCMNKKISRIIGLVMVVIAIVFVVFALNHPEMSFPWNNTITWVLYGLYAIVTAVLLIAPTKKK